MICYLNISFYQLLILKKYNLLHIETLKVDKDRREKKKKQLLYITVQLSL